MKKLGILIIILSAIYFVSSCESNFKNSPRNTGGHVFEILKSLDTLDEASFRSHFTSFAIFKESLEEFSFEENLKQKLRAMDSTEYNSELNKTYQRIVREAENNYIRWANIEYVYYEYNFGENEGVTGYFGDLYFKYHTQLFKIRIFSYEYNDTLNLIGLSDIALEEERTFE